MTKVFGKDREWEKKFQLMGGKKCEENTIEEWVFFFHHNPDGPLRIIKARRHKRFEEFDLLF
jgi:hypothetical protein